MQMLHLLVLAPREQTALFTSWSQPVLMKKKTLSSSPSGQVIWQGASLTEMARALTPDSTPELLDWT